MRKASQRDFGAKDLPRTRKEAFCFSVRNRLALYVRLGFLLFLALLPLLATVILKDNAILDVRAHLATEALSEAERNAALSAFRYQAELVSNAILVPCFLLFGLALAGVLETLKRLLWGEPIFLAHDFIRGIRRNGLHHLLAFLAFGLGRYGAFLAFGALPDFWRYAPFAFLYLFLAPALLLSLFTNLIYVGGPFRHIANALRLFAAKVPSVLAASSLVFLPFLALVALDFSLLIGYIAFALLTFSLPFALAVFFLCSTAIFDRYVNLRQFPALVNKGLVYGEKEPSDD